MNYRLRGTLHGTDRSEAWIVDGKLTFQQPEGAVSDVVGHILPGLVDAHGHPALGYTEDLVSDAEIRRRLELHRSAGVTAIRDAGGQRHPGEATTSALPKIIHCGQHIAQFKRYTRHLAIDVDPSELAETAVAQLERSDGWVKIVGDWIDREIGDLAPLWPKESLREAVAAVHERGGKVLMHTFARETLEGLFDAGVDCIEHGTGMEREHYQEAALQGTLIDPTIFQTLKFPLYAEWGKKFPDYSARMLAMHERRAERITNLLESGCEMVMGTDTNIDVDVVAMPQELVAAVSEGIPAERAMEAASWGGRKRLGLSAWDEGADADFVVYRDNPIADIYQVLRPERVFIRGVEYETRDMVMADPLSMNR